MIYITPCSGRGEDNWYQNCGARLLVKFSEQLLTTPACWSPLTGSAKVGEAHIQLWRVCPRGLLISINDGEDAEVVQQHQRTN